jgi:phosphomevalonate kinase
MKVLLLSGWSTSGKDTVGKILEKQYKAFLFAFADILKEIVAQEYNFPVSLAHTEKGKQTVLANGKTVRELLIKRGQEIRKEKNDTGYFSRIIAKQIQTLSLMVNPPNLVVITDWRLPIELDVIKSILSCPVHTVRIQRKGLTASPIKDSETESQLDNYGFDCIIENDGVSLETLKAEVLKKLGTI